MDRQQAFTNNSFRWQMQAESLVNGKPMM